MSSAMVEFLDPLQTTTAAKVNRFMRGGFLIDMVP